MSTGKMSILPAKGKSKGGPKTLTGKNVSAKNSLKYGFYASKNLLVKGESEEELKLVRIQILQHFEPRDTVEMILVEQIIAHLWKVRRIQNFKTSLMNECITELPRHERTPGAEGKEFKHSDLHQGVHWQNRFALFARYEQSEQKAFYRALHELQRIQGRKRGEKIPLPKCVDVNMMM